MKTKRNHRPFRITNSQWNRDMLHSNMSCTKSFTSACIGIAIDHGFIDDVNQSIFDYLPDHQHFTTASILPSNTCLL
jgi:CubicO group peptidase (beta-lactamase class C family)